MKDTLITTSEIDHLQAMRERAESSYASACQMLAVRPDEFELLMAVQSAALRLSEARSQYAMALAAVTQSQDDDPVGVAVYWDGGDDVD